MFEIPVSFRSENENYITNISLRDFVSSYARRRIRVSGNRPELINDLCEFADQSPDNRKIVLNWIDTIVKEGIKEVHINFVNVSDETNKIINSNEKIDEIFCQRLHNKENRHLCGNSFGNELSLVDYEYVDNVLSFIFCKKVYIYDRQKQVTSSIYPIYVDFIVNKKIIIGRAKSKSGMYPYSEKELNIDMLPVKLTAEKEICNAIKLTSMWLSMDVDVSLDADKLLRLQLYKLLDKFTRTPEEIKHSLEMQENQINNIVDTIVNKVSENSKKCNEIMKKGYHKEENGEKYKEDIKLDVYNLFEKYFSISFPDKSIFMRGQAYPIKILATDDEESRVEQSAADEEPLQTKAVFFDNKKMINKSHLCDNILFCYNRINKKYASDSKFKVRLGVKNGTCIVKFTEYVREEDIKNVLFSIIDA